jgi:hypothetical protein
MCDVARGPLIRAACPPEQSTLEHEMTLDFGRTTLARAEELSRLGKDANQIAAILCDRDAEGYNFGIGIVIESDGKPMKSSKTLLDALHRELASCEYGRYLNSADAMPEFKAKMLEFQGVPKSLWDSIEIAVPSDAGTGAVKLALEYAFARNDELSALHVEELGWPAYRSSRRVPRAPRSARCPWCSIAPIRASSSRTS